MNKAGLELVKGFEGLSLSSYQCAAGVWTIGWGHTGEVDGRSIRRGMTITREKAERLLEADLASFWELVERADYVPLTDSLTENQKSALCSFAFNCGGNSLRTLCRNRTKAEIAEALLLYNKAGGKVLKGLTDRRKAERELFLKDAPRELSTLRRGEGGQQVRALQKLLGGLTVDGEFGPATEQAVLDFQRANGLTEDGIVGPKTWKQLLC